MLRMGFLLTLSVRTSVETTSLIITGVGKVLYLFFRKRVWSDVPMKFQSVTWKSNYVITTFKQLTESTISY